MKGPIFIVGCPRSGTTILQASISEAHGLFSFPESQLPYRFASFTDDGRLTRLNRLGMIRKNSKNLLLDWSDSAGLDTHRLRRRATLAGALRDYRRIVESNSGGLRWIEKSPLNFMVTGLILRYFSDALVVHIVRNPLENIASLIDASTKYRPFRKYGGPEGQRFAVRTWQHAARAIQAYATHPRHFVIRYKEFATYPTDALQGLSGRIGIEYTDRMLAPDTSGIVRTSESWKRQHPQSIAPARSRAHDVFSAHDIQEIAAEVAPFETLIDDALSSRGNSPGERSGQGHP